MPRDEDLESLDPEDELESDEEVDDSSDQAGDTDDEDESDDEEDREDPRIRRLQRRLTNQGRRLSSATTRASNAEQRAAQLDQRLRTAEAQLQSIGMQMTTAEQQRQEQYINSLPPEQQALERVKLLENRIAGKGQPRVAQPTPPGTGRSAPRTGDAPPVPPQRVEYLKQRSQEIIEAIEDEFDIELTDEDLELADWETEEAFTRTATRVARMKAKGGKPVASKKPTSKVQSDEDDEEETPRRTRNVASSPNSARPVPSGRRRAPATAEQFNTVLSGYDSSKGPKAMKRELEKLSRGSR